MVSGKGTWQINWGQGPWTWSDNTTALPLLGANVSSILALQTTAPAKVSADLVATLPIAGTLTLSAHDQNNGNGVIGTMVLSGTGVNIVDLNASRVLVDQGTGMALAPFHPPGPEVALTLKEATGVFAYVKQAGDWRLQLAGLYAMPLIKGVKLQDNIMQALGGKVALIGGLGDFALSGQYEAIDSLKPKAFCEYGTGVTTRFGAAGGLWAQAWMGGPWAWHKCPPTVNATFLGPNVTGELETTTTGTPTVDNNMILRAGLAGRLTLTASNPGAHQDRRPDHRRSEGDLHRGRQRRPCHLRFPGQYRVCFWGRRPQRPGCLRHGDQGNRRLRRYSRGGRLGSVRQRRHEP